jgi:hypothetical protein
MLKFRISFFVLFILILLGVATVTFTTRDHESGQVLPATINRDCAPWDGPAFRVTIPWEAGSHIDISIWQAPEIKFGKTFTFPATDGQAGNASYWSAAGNYEPLHGSVSFQGVEEASSVRGRFELESEAGRHLEGQFTAQWQSQLALCG